MNSDSSEGSASSPVSGPDRPGQILDRVLPGPGGRVDRISQRLQDVYAAAGDTVIGRPILYLLRGNAWLGHPAHPVLVTVPVGAWVVSSWYDLKSTRPGRSWDEHAADGALRIGIVGAVLAAATGVAQFVDTRDQARRETGVHAALNNAALALNLVSLGLRGAGRRQLGRRVSVAALAVVGVSGYLGGDLAYRHGIGSNRHSEK
jgi:uncharacterized membrane protein